jgi:iron-sulfur cluster assembly protein
MIETTPNALRHLRELLEARHAPEGHGLRLAVERGGCAGWQYSMRIGAAEMDDVVVERDGVRVFLAPDCVPLVRGSRLDYHESLSDSGFRLENPNAVRSCGCGTSFETESP